MRGFGYKTNFIATHFTRYKTFSIEDEKIFQSTFIKRTLQQLCELFKTKTTPGLVPLSVFGNPAMYAKDLLKNGYKAKLDKTESNIIWEVLCEACEHKKERQI